MIVKYVCGVCGYTSPEVRTDSLLTESKTCPICFSPLEVEVVEVTS